LSFEREKGNKDGERERERERKKGGREKEREGERERILNFMGTKINSS